MDKQAAILNLFLDEGTELIQKISLELLAIERNPETLSEGRMQILRAAHTMKGSASAAGADEVERKLHAFESCAQRLGSVLHVTEGVFESFHRMLDAIESAIAQVCTGQCPAVVEPPPTPSELRAVFGEDIDFSPFGVAPMASTTVRGPGAVGRGTTPDTTIRVATEKLDRQMAAVEELVRVKVGAQLRANEAQRVYDLLEDLAGVVAKLRPLNNGRGSGASARDASLNGMLDAARRYADEAFRQTEALARGVRTDADLLDTLTGRLHDDIRALRMVPVASVWSSLDRTARDVARKRKKAVLLRLEGGETEIDRDLLEQIRGALVHLLRNAIDHGIEPQAERARLGKMETSELVIRAESRRGGLRLIVRDDGRGIDPEVVRASALKSGIVSEEELRDLPESAIQLLVLRAGFSTAASLSEISGRGVGLDAVRAAVEQSGGSMELHSVPGKGTEFVLNLPLSLTTLRMLIVRVGSELFALPTGAIERVVRVEPGDVHLLDTGSAIEHDGRPVSTTRLSDVLGLPSLTLTHRQPGLVISSGGMQAVVLVDAIDEEQEIVVKSLGEYFVNVPHIAGATVLPSGRIVPVLSVPDIVRTARGVKQGNEPLFAAADAPRARSKRILIVDDSITTRTLEKSILEAVGYTVEIATDGVDALARIERGNFDLVLSDVQMPRMDGIELTKRVKASERHRGIPLVLVSSLIGDDDKKRGLQAGADAYLGKQEFRQEALLEILNRLL
jgi:two-component system, chemotaxis family, sensor kinase CheA